LEGVLILHEVVHEMRVKKHEGIIIKLDFEKAYDKLNWEFMREFMRKKEFPEVWIGWVMHAVEEGR
jgi:hypothetical protein